jgi:hypothetical protein
MSKRAKRFKVGDRVYLRSRYGGVVEDSHRNTVKVAWPGGLAWYEDAKDIAMCPPVRATPEARPKVAKKKARTK